MPDDDAILMDLLGVYRRPVVPPPSGPRGRQPGKGNQTPGNPVGTNPPGKGGGKGGGGNQGKGKGAPGLFGGGSDTSVLVATTQTTFATSTGNQDITITDLGWTPKVAIFWTSANSANATPEDSLIGAFGVATEGGQWFVSCTSNHAAATTQTSRLCDKTGCIGYAFAHATTPSVGRRAEFVSFISDGIRINHTVANAGTHLLNVMFLGGGGLQAAVGFGNLAGVGSATTFTPGFKTNALILGIPAPDTSSSFSASAQTQGTIGLGFGAYDGTTVTQCGHRLFDVHNSASGDPRAGNSSTAIVPVVNGSGSATLGTPTSTQFSLTTASVSMTGVEVGYLALNLSGQLAKASMLTLPTATGAYSVTAPGFQPVGGFIIPTHMTTATGVSVAGAAGAMGVTGLDATNAYSFSIAEEDISDPTDNQRIIDNKAFNLPEHQGTASYVGTFTAMTATGADFNFTAVAGTSRFAPSLWIGSDS